MKKILSFIIPLSLSFVYLFLASIFTLSPNTVFADHCPPEFPECHLPASTGGSSGPSSIGTIDNPNLPSISGNENEFVAGIVRNGIQLLLIISFIIAFIWTILAGLQFILANGDPKNVSTAWSRIYWGLIGMAVIMASFAIIKIVETFFGIDILSGGLRLPRI